MNIRNATHAPGGRINVEYEHPTYGWIPYTAAPNDVEATGRAIYAAAFAAGGIADMPVPPVVVPQSVSPRQIRQALTAAGLRASVEAAIAASDQDTKDWYEFSTAFERSHPAVIAMGVALGVSSDALDDLWKLAGSL